MNIPHNRVLQKKKQKERDERNPFRERDLFCLFFLFLSKNFYRNFTFSADFFVAERDIREVTE